MFASGSPSCGISNVIRHVTMAGKNMFLPFLSCFSARTVLPWLILSMGRVSDFPESYVAWFMGF